MARTERDPGEEAEVLAAGGVVVRGAGAAARIAVIHRPKYEDWTLPKGKLDPGEGFEQAALREVEEETGLAASWGVSWGQSPTATARAARSWSATG